MNIANTWNTPGYYYAIAYWLSAFVLTRLHPHPRKGWRKWLTDFAFFVLLSLFMTATDGIREMLFVPSMAVIIALIFLYIFFSIEASLTETGYYCVKAFISGEFAASLCWQIYYYLINSGASQGPVLRWAEILLVYAAVFICICLLEKHLGKDMEALRISRRELLVVVLVALAVFVVSNMSYLDRNSLFSGRFAMDIFIIRTLVDLSGLAMLYAFHIQVKEMQMRFEKDTLQNIMDMQYKTYQLSQDSIDIVNQKYHDLKHQITLLKAEADTEKSTRYLEQMEKEIKVYETQNKTGNKVLDAVLTVKSANCQRRNIELKVMAEGALLDFMEDMDISALFGNMLDNAIECAERQNAPEKRLIWLSLVHEKQFLRIRIENYCEETIRFRGGMPVTTKKDKHLHGFGMKSIQKTVEKYGGSVVAAQEDHWFKLKILIPIEPEK